ncbi:hypothetical protein NW762_010815 [Fusarium torreyae]|uniref:NACHT domain-containing protein n=1 Tax=Fusarium torreyae TaxID=1237075 RepID=A0A9W8RSJ9_9HYPO|nr:hypothetical protein NW762_010815 [Fusarium torreyae]
MSGAEAATAFGLAAGIIQVIGFSLQLWDATDNVRKTGSTVTTADCEREANILLKQCEEVKALQTVKTQLPESVRLKNRLWFNAIPHRHDAITEAHSKTFEWAFTETETTELSNTSFSEWMLKGEGLYWVSGRAGTGKSSFMRFLNDDPRTTSVFKQWAGDRPLVVASFYFWNNPEQETDSRLRRLEGIYQGLLYKILEAAPQLAELLFPDHVGGRDWGSFPTLLDMKQAFTRLLQAHTLPVAIALVIDGLDEYDAPPGDQIALSNMLKEAAAKPHVKVLVSGRPEFAFEASFENCMRLKLDKLTEVDRKIYVTDSLWKEPRFIALKAATEEKESLISQIVEKSEGIFLWLRIVVSALQEELHVAKSIDMLTSLVNDTPDGKKELPELFEHMLWKRIQPQFRYKILLFFPKTTQLNNKHTSQDGRSSPNRSGVERRKPELYVATGLLYSFLDENSSLVKAQPLTETERQERIDRTATELRRSCAGLLEMRAAPPFFNDTEQLNYIKQHCDAVADPEVHFLHKDVSLFLNEQKQKDSLNDTLRSDEPALLMNLLECLVMVVKTCGKSSTLDQNDIPENILYPDEEDFPWQLAEAIMRVARLTEETNPEGTENALDQLDEAMSRHLSFWLPPSLLAKHPKSHWANFFPYDDRHLKPAFYPWPTVEEQYGLDFLSLAVQNGLFYYVQTKLKKDPSRLNRRGLPLLSSACAQVPRWYLLPNTIDSRTVKMLLDLGANPNEEFKGYTPWEMALVVALDSIILSLSELEELAQILRLLLQHGADAGAKVKWFEYANAAARDYSPKQRDRFIEEQIQIAFVYRFTEGMRAGTLWVDKITWKSTRNLGLGLKAEAVEKDRFIKIGNELVSLCQQKKREQPILKFMLLARTKKAKAVLKRVLKLPMKRWVNGA